MAPFAEYTLESGGTVRIETVAESQCRSPKDDQPEGATPPSLNEALAGVQQTAGQLIQNFKSLNIDEMELSFGLIVCDGGGQFMVSQKPMEGNFAVKVRWRSSHRLIGPGLI